MKKNSEKKEIEKKIPLKNYFIILAIFAAAIILVLYIRNVYQVYKQEKLQIPVIRDTLSEIKPDELEHYLQDNPTTIVYICTAEDKKCRDYESSFKKYIKREELQDSIVYLNISEEKETFTEDFNNAYNYRRKLTDNYPALVSFEDGKINNLLQVKEKDKLTIAKTRQFVELQKIGD